MQLPSVFQRYRTAIEDELRLCLQEYTLPLYDMLRYHLGWMDEHGITQAGPSGKALRPTELLIFGNPQGGTPFMECAQSVGIDLPLKALVWEDAMGKVWISYNEPAFLAQRHDVPGCPAVESLKKALVGITDAAAK